MAYVDARAVHGALQSANSGAARFDGNTVELMLHHDDGTKSRFDLVYASPTNYPSTPLLIVPDDPSLSTAAEVSLSHAVCCPRIHLGIIQAVNEPLYDGAPLPQAVLALATALNCTAAVEALQALPVACSSQHECDDMEDVDEGVDDNVFVDIEEDDTMLVHVMQQYSRWQQKEIDLTKQDNAASLCSMQLLC